MQHINILIVAVIQAKLIPTQRWALCPGTVSLTTLELTPLIESYMHIIFCMNTSTDKQRISAKNHPYTFEVSKSNRGMSETHMLYV